MEIGRIIVGVDGSDDARRAAAWAATVAGAVGAEVVVVHALGLLHRTPSGVTVASDLHRAEILAELEAAWCAPLRDAGVVYRAELREGNPVIALLDAADDADADLLVVGSRGVGGFPGLMLGSTSTQLAQHTRWPLVIVPNTSQPR
jgi:nucleotide-binding universal stress UspA family protein